MKQAPEGPYANDDQRGQSHMGDKNYSRPECNEDRPPKGFAVLRGTGRVRHVRRMRYAYLRGDLFLNYFVFQLIANHPHIVHTRGLQDEKFGPNQV